MKKPSLTLPRYLAAVSVCLCAAFAHYVEGQPYAPILNFTCLLASVWPVNIAHEIGHAVCALLLRMRLFQIEFGTGEERRSFHIGGVKVILNRGIAGGKVSFAPRSKRFARLRIFLAILAGPATNIVLAWFAYLLSRYDSLYAAMFDFGASAAVSFASMFIWVSVLHVLIDLWPSPQSDEEQSDGFRLLSVAFWPDSRIDLGIYAASGDLPETLQDAKKEAAIWLAAERSKGEQPGRPMPQ